MEVLTALSHCSPGFPAARPCTALSGPQLVGTARTDGTAFSLGETQDRPLVTRKHECKNINSVNPWVSKLATIPLLKLLHVPSPSDNASAVGRCQSPRDLLPFSEPGLGLTGAACRLRAGALRCGVHVPHALEGAVLSPHGG